MLKRYLDALTSSNSNIDQKHARKYDIGLQTIFTIPKKSKNHLRRQDSNLRMPTPKTCAMPKGACPMAEYLDLSFEKF